MSNMFYNCQNLQSVKIYGDSSSNYIIPNDFRLMFYNCINLKSVNFEYFDLAHIHNTSYMFYNCKQLLTFTRANFQNCGSSNINVKNSMRGMFQNCECWKF